MDRSPQFDAATLKEEVRALALSLGAADVRITGARALPQTRVAMQEAFARGDFETWPYDDRYASKAVEPSSLLDGARSVICVAVPYRTERPHVSRLQGRVSNYAWSRDYHRRMQTMLRTIAAHIDARMNAPVTAVACDTKPLAERAFAARAGLGWIGKHTNLISRTAGSFVFLGEIVTSVQLAEDPPLRKTCGACTRCIPACPTGALRGDYTIDASKCISDLTQRTGGIPRDMRPLIGTWVWGCDICQDVCPPNENKPMAQSGEDIPYARSAAAPELISLLHMRSGDFKRIYARTAMGWRGAAVLRRNAAVALGNALDRSTVRALVRSLNEDPHAMVRSHAAWALGRIASPAALRALSERGDVESDPGVIEEISAALEPFANATALHGI